MYTSGDVFEIVGFDSAGEPSIQILEDGNIQVMFALMPPSYADALDHWDNFEDFDDQLASELDCKVFWEDREFFIIENPKSETLAKLVEYLSTYQNCGSYRNRDRKLLGNAPYRLIQIHLKKIFIELERLGYTERLPRSGLTKTYVREIEGGQQKIHFMYDSNSRNFDYFLDLRLDIVEQIYYRFKWFWMSGMKESNTSTLKTRLMHLSSIEDASTNPSTLNEIDNTIANVEKTILEFGIPFYETNKNLKSIEQTLNGNLEIQIDDRKNLMQEQGIRAVILAKLSSNSNFDSIVSHFERTKDAWAEREASNWSMLLEYLELNH